MTNNTTAALTDEQRKEVCTALDYLQRSGFFFESECLRALLTSPRAAVPEGWKLVPVERSYDMRAKAIIAFNTTEKASNDRDDALDAAYRAMLDAAPAAVAESMPDENSDEFRAACKMAAKASAAGIGPCGVFIAGYRALRSIDVDVGEPGAAQAVAADGAATGEPAAWLVSGQNGYGEETSSAHVKRATADSYAAMLFRARIEPLTRCIAVAADERADPSTKGTHPGCEVCACPTGVCQSERSGSASPANETQARGGA